MPLDSPPSTRRCHPADTPAPLDVLMVGHFAKDRNVTDGVGRTAAGGGVYFGSMTLRRMGLQVAVVTRLHPDDFPMLDELRREGIRVHAAAAEATSGIENVYDSADMERRTCTPLGFAGPFAPADIPPTPSRVVMITPIIAGEVDHELVAHLDARTGSPLGLDVQGFVRVREHDRLVFKPWSEMERTLRHITFLKTDRAEAELLTGLTDLNEAAARLGSYGPAEVIVTQTTGVTVHADGRTHTFPFTPRSLAGRTGRGDTCFAAYVGLRFTAPPAEAARFAAAVTSVKQEQPGPFNGDMEAVRARMAEAD